MQIFQESSRVRAIYLRVVELECNRQLIPQIFFSVSAPTDEWIVEDTAIHADDAVKFGFNDCRGADDHIVVRQVLIITILDDPIGVFKIIVIK